MDRRAAAQALSTTAAFALSLHAEAEAELSSAREEVAQLRAALAQERAEVTRLRERSDGEARDYAQTVTDLRGKLREEEARRATYQASHSAAVRFVAEALANPIEETRSGPGFPSLAWRTVRLGVMAETWEALRDRARA